MLHSRVSAKSVDACDGDVKDVEDLVTESHRCAVVTLYFSVLSR